MFLAFGVQTGLGGALVSPMEKILALLTLVFVVGFYSTAFAADTVGTAQLGSKVTFTAAVGTGTPPFTYQWNKGGVPIAGAITQTLVIPAVANTDAGTYTCTVTNPAGQGISNNAVFTVTLVPPSNVTITISNG